MTGTLYLVGTPIGNLEDMTYRAVRILKEADLIACEDTRTSAPLLRHYEITTPVTSYHKFNEENKGDVLLEKLLSGENVALITDAGMPAVSDPGEILVRKCTEARVPVTVIPGPSASLAALAVSALDTRRFVFEGFLPGENKEKKEVLARLEEEPRTMILYEAPHRLVKTLTSLAGVLGSARPVTICRELTKKFETVTVTTLEGALSLCEKTEPRGEYVLVIAGMSPGEAQERRAEAWASMDIPSHVAYYEARGLDRKEAMKAAARDRGISKRDVYQALLSL